MNQGGVYISSNDQYVVAQKGESESKEDCTAHKYEGTASAAELSASSLHDNGRTVALVGTKTFGKGLIQHKFPMPDGGGDLRLTRWPSI